MFNQLAASAKADPQILISRDWSVFFRRQEYMALHMLLEQSRTQGRDLKAMAEERKAFLLTKIKESENEGDDIIT